MAATQLPTVRRGAQAGSRGRQEGEVARAVWHLVLDSRCASKPASWTAWMMWRGPVTSGLYVTSALPASRFTAADCPSHQPPQLPGQQHTPPRLCATILHTQGPCQLRAGLLGCIPKHAACWLPPRVQEPVCM